MWFETRFIRMYTSRKRFSQSWSSGQLVSSMFDCSGGSAHATIPSSVCFALHKLCGSTHSLTWCLFSETKLVQVYVSSNYFVQIAGCLCMVFPSPGLSSSHLRCLPVWFWGEFVFGVIAFLRNSLVALRSEAWRQRLLEPQPTLSNFKVPVFHNYLICWCLFV